MIWQDWGHLATIGVRHPLYLCGDAWADCSALVGRKVQLPPNRRQQHTHNRRHRKHSPNRRQQQKSNRRQ
jgi:hypothetical protein